MRRLETTSDWWWTVSVRDDFCQLCGEPIPKGSTIAYDNHRIDAFIVCEICADETGIAVECKESKRYRKARTTT